MRSICLGLKYFLLLIIFLQSHDYKPIRLGNPFPVDFRCVEPQRVLFHFESARHLTDSTDIYESVAFVDSEDLRRVCHSQKRGETMFHHELVSAHAYARQTKPMVTSALDRA